MYLIIGLRPDIGFAVVKLAQQMANPSNNHYQVGLHLCRYLLVTYRYQLVYNGLSNKLLVAYSDSDWGQDHEHRKSTTGYFTMLAQGITFWLSRKQKSVALSSTKAEYMALSDCSHQLVWTSNLLSVRDVWSRGGVTRSGAELLWSRRELTTKVGEQPWSQLVRCASICCRVCSCVFQED